MVATEEPQLIVVDLQQELAGLGSLPPLQQELALQKAQVGRLTAVAEFQRGRVRSMKVLAGAHGILQELPLEVGQWAQSGATPDPARTASATALVIEMATSEVPAA